MASSALKDQPDGSVARVIHRAREQAGLSSQDVANLVGVGLRQVQNWSAGKGRPADRRRLKTLLDLQYVLDLLSDIYDPESALIWLHARNRLLGGERPLDLLSTPEGADEVIKLLDRLADGNF
jgi:hypothetical protein